MYKQWLALCRLLNNQSANALYLASILIGLRRAKACLNAAGKPVKTPQQLEDIKTTE
jgi:hypothetical protein